MGLNLLYSNYDLRLIFPISIFFLFYLEKFVSEKLTLALNDKKFLKFCYIYKNDLNLMIFQIGWAALAAIFTFSIAMVVWGRNGDGSIDI